jgi:uracil-DNA glycosylase
MIPPVPAAWAPLIGSETEKPYFRELGAFLEQAAASGQSILPPASEIFRALELTPPSLTRVVLLGQDPYPTPGHAHGLCFSVQPDVRPIPGSLRNIYKELESDIPGFRKPSHGCLESWARQGVVLLNTVMTVPAGEAAGHRRRGWETFTDAVIQAVTRLPHRVVFVLWGNDAKKKLPLIPAEPHRAVVNAHPSPLSARLFLGCRCFSTINRHLVEAGQSPIDWTIPEQARSTPQQGSLFGN